MMPTARERAEHAVFEDADEAVWTDTADVITQGRLDVVERLREMAQAERDMAMHAADAGVMGEYRIRDDLASNLDEAAELLEVEIRKAGEP